AGAAGFPIHEIEAVSTAGIYDDKVIRPACLGCPFLPLPAFLGLRAKHQSAESGGKVAVGKVLGRTGSFSTSGCTKNTDAREGVHKAEAFAIAPIPEHRLRVEFGQAFFAIGHSKNGRGWPVNPASQNGKNGCQGQAPAALSRPARVWRHPTGGRLGMVPRAARLWAGSQGMQS